MLLVVPIAGASYAHIDARSYTVRIALAYAQLWYNKCDNNNNYCTARCHIKYVLQNDELRVVLEKLQQRHSELTIACDGFRKKVEQAKTIHPRNL